jgi:hypothetical protein
MGRVERWKIGRAKTSSFFPSLFTPSLYSFSPGIPVVFFSPACVREARFDLEQGQARCRIVAVVVIFVPIVPFLAFLSLLHSFTPPDPPLLLGSTLTLLPPAPHSIHPGITILRICNPRVRLSRNRAYKKQNGQCMKNSFYSFILAKQR